MTADTDGGSADSFSLPGTTIENHESAVSGYTLEGALETGRVVVNDSVSDVHPACATRLCGLSDLDCVTVRGDVAVFGISGVRWFSHLAVAAQHASDLPLLSDSTGGVAEDDGVPYDEFHGHKPSAERSVFLVDGESVVRYSWSTDDPAEHPGWIAVTELLDGIAAVSAKLGPGIRPAAIRWGVPRRPAGRVQRPG